MAPLKTITSALLVVGGLNWGLVGLFEFNLVAMIFGDTTFVSRAIYTIVGLSAVHQIFAYPWTGKEALIGEQRDHIKKAA